jgi:hypothetical protein
MLGACIPVASQDSLSRSINGWEQYFDRSLSKAQGREGKFARYFLRPLHAGSLKLWKVSQPISNEHVRAGTRLAATAYFWAAMLFALVIAVYVIVGIVILMIVLAVIGWYLNRNERSSGGDSYIPARVKGAPDPIWWTVGLRWFLSFVLLVFFQEKVIDVGAVDNCALCSCPSSLWARSVRPQGRQRPHRRRSRENLQGR